MQCVGGSGIRAFLLDMHCSCSAEYHPCGKKIAVPVVAFRKRYSDTSKVLPGGCLSMQAKALGRAKHFYFCLQQSQLYHQLRFMP